MCGQRPVGQSLCCSLSPHPGQQPCEGGCLIPSCLRHREARWPVLGPTGRERHPFLPSPRAGMAGDSREVTHGPAHS